MQPHSCGMGGCVGCHRPPHSALTWRAGNQSLWCLILSLKRDSRACSVAAAVPLQEPLLKCWSSSQLERLLRERRNCWANCLQEPLKTPHQHRPPGTWAGGCLCAGGHLFLSPMGVTVGAGSGWFWANISHPQVPLPRARSRLCWVWFHRDSLAECGDGRNRQGGAQMCSSESQG